MNCDVYLRDFRDCLVFTSNDSVGKKRHRHFIPKDRPLPPVVTANHPHMGGASRYEKVVQTG